MSDSRIGVAKEWVSVLLKSVTVGLALVFPAAHTQTTGPHVVPLPGTT